jgi:N-acetylneuraminic acid mutarotase
VEAGECPALNNNQGELSCLSSCTASTARCGGGGSSNTPAPPAITTQPADQSVTAGANAAFSVAATGPSLAYQWQSSPNGTTWSDVAGATSATLTLTAVAITDSGKRLRAVVSNSDGSVTSSAALLTVNAAPAQFTALASALAVGRAAHAAALLANGQVLITGGFSAPTIPAPALASAEFYNPATNAFAAVAGTMVLARTSHTATTLPNGQVLIAGGQYNNNDDGHATAELYNPATQSFAAVAAAMTSPRGGHAAVLLNDGRVLITGGYNNSSVSLNSAELFDPATQTFTPIAATMTSRRSEHSATLLPDGRVLLAGGGSSNTVYNGAELYDPAIQTFTALAAVMSAAREGGAASLLPSGRVLLSGGGTLGANPPASLVALNSADVYDPTSQTFTAAAATMTTRRVVHTQTLLPDGRVLLVGGGNLDANGALVILNSAEIYGP